MKMYLPVVEKQILSCNPETAHDPQGVLFMRDDNSLAFIKIFQIIFNVYIGIR